MVWPKVHTEVVEDMPQMLRWHMELLILEIDSLKTLDDTRSNIGRFVDTTERLAKTIEGMPKNIRGQSPTSRG